MDELYDYNGCDNVIKTPNMKIIDTFLMFSLS